MQMPVPKSLLIESSENTDTLHEFDRFGIIKASQHYDNLCAAVKETRNHVIQSLLVQFISLCSEFSHKISYLHRQCPSILWWQCIREWGKSIRHFCNWIQTEWWLWCYFVTPPQVYGQSKCAVSCYRTAFAFKPLVSNQFPQVFRIPDLKTLQWLLGNHNWINCCHWLDLSPLFIPVAIT